MDVESRKRWVEYSRAKDEMFAHTDIKEAPWFVVASDVKKHARLNCIAHLLSLIPYEEVERDPVLLGERPPQSAYIRPPKGDQNFVPEVHRDHL